MTVLSAVLDLGGSLVLSCRPVSNDALRALVAEDEPAMLSLNAGFLRQKGFDVTEASDGEKAWALAATGTFDLVLLDVMMPGMSGWEVCKRIKHSPETRGTSVIMLTGIGETLNDATSPLFAADAWLNKPYDFDELERKLREALGRFNKPMPGGGSDFYAPNDDAPMSLPTDSLSGGPAIAKTHGARPPAKKAAKKAASKKPAPKKAAPKKAAPKKAAPKKAAKAAPKKAAPKKAAPAKKAAPKAAAKKAAPKKAAKPAKKAPAKKR
jgi:DNA-binding response OmpR family regulator